MMFTRFSPPSIYFFSKMTEEVQDYDQQIAELLQTVRTLVKDEIPSLKGKARNEVRRKILFFSRKASSPQKKMSLPRKLSSPMAGSTALSSSYRASRSS